MQASLRFIAMFHNFKKQDLCEAEHNVQSKAYTVL